MKNPSTEIKKIIGRNVPIYYPNAGERFIIHKDTGRMQLGIVINVTQGFHCLLLTKVHPRLINYTATVRKVLSIAETLKDNSVPFY